MRSAGHARERRGFTLIELLVVIGIILLLLAILLPVVSQVRTRAYQATTQAQMSRIMGACQSYFHDFNSYPGPIANTYLSGGATAGADPSSSALPPPGGLAVTSSENLVLGLLGYLSPPTAVGGAVTFTQTGFPTSAGAVVANPVQPPIHDVLSLNPLHPASYHYIDYVPDELSPGPTSAMDYVAGQTPTDTCVPEFVDRFPEHIPILYMRANTGNPGTGSAPAIAWVGTTDSGYQYNYSELKDYGTYVHETIPPATYPSAWFGPGATNGGVQFGTISYFTGGLYPLSVAGSLADDMAVPYNDWANGTPVAGNSYYLANPNIADSVLGKDGFVLISAGVDHVYGTHDDIIVTP